MAWPSTGSYTAWSKCFKVTSQASKISAVNSWYFLDLALMPSAFWSAVQADGDDLRFVEDDLETAVNHKLIFIDTGTSKGLVAVAQPHGSSGATVDIDTYCFVGNAGASSTSTSATFPSSMTCLYMLQEAPTSAAAIIDYTSNARNSTAIDGSMTSGDLVSTGPHAGLKCIQFDSNDRATIPAAIFNDCEAAGAYTWFGWLRPVYESANQGAFGAKGTQMRITRKDNSTNNRELIVSQRNAANSASFTATASSSTPTLSNAWSLIHSVYNGSTLKGYMNGVEVCSVAATSLQNASVDYWIGHDNATYWRGDLAQIGFYATALSADQIATIYANETDAGFWVVTENTGTSGSTGTGTLTSAAATISGSGTQTLDGTGAASGPAATVSGSGIVGKTGTGALTPPAATLAGVGAQTVSGSGAISSPAATISGDGVGSVPVNGTGALEAPMPLLSASGEIESGDQSLVGALTVQVPVVSGSAITGRTGTAALVAPKPVVAGSGKSTISGTGALVAPSSYVISGIGVLSPPSIVGTGALNGTVPVVSGTGFVVDGDEATVDAIGWYLTGADAEGRSQRSQAASLGGFRSGVCVKSMVWDCDQPMVGVEIIEIGALNGVGSGSLEAVTSDSIRWTPPNGRAGTAVDLLSGNEATLFGFESGAWIKVRRRSTIPMVGIHTVQCLDVYNNAIAFDNVASADAVAGSVKYRAIMGRNSYSGPAINMAIWLDAAANENIEIGYELAVAGEIQSIADEDTAPTGITWVNGITDATGILIPYVPAGDSFGIWIKRTIAADSDPTPRLLNHIHVKFSDLTGTDHYDDLRGKYRIARNDFVTYGLWVGQDEQPDFSVAANEEFTSLPHTTALTLDASHIYYATLRQRNKWGLWSQNMESTTLPLDAAGEQTFVKPSAPNTVAITQTGSENYPIVSARYEPAFDDDHRGDIFVIWYTRDDSAPDPTDTPSGYKVMNGRVGIETLKFTASGADFIDETPVKALVRTRRLAIGSGTAFSPDTTQLPASGAGTIVVDSELAGWDSTGFMKITTFSGALQEVVEYDTLVVGSGISTFTVLSGGRAQWGTTAAATATNSVIYPVYAVDSDNTTATEYVVDGIAPGRPWGELLFGNEAAQEQTPIAGPDGVTVEYIDEPNNIYLLLGEGWCELWMDTVLVWKVFQDGNTTEQNAVYVPYEWDLVADSVSGASTGVFDAVDADNLYIVAGSSRKVHIDASAMTITMLTLSSLGNLPEVAPTSSTWEQYAGSLLQSWDPQRSDYRPYAQITTDGELAMQWAIDNSLTQAEIVAL